MDKHRHLWTNIDNESATLEREIFLDTISKNILRYVYLFFKQLEIDTELIYLQLSVR